MQEPRYIIQLSNNFRKDYKLMEKRWYDIKELDARYRNHKLKWNLKNYRDIHITPDWVLIYQYLWDNIISFERTGTHSDLLE
jgi:mRNA interferase YafQ